MYSEETIKIIKRLQKARLSLMKAQPFYAVLLLHIQFSIDPMCETAYTDGTRIAFGPEFIEEISDKELEFVLMHEVMHIALSHCRRTKDSYDYDKFNVACDIVVNSNILYSSDFDLSAITLKKYGPGIHETPNGDEGYLHTAEEVYEMVLAEAKASDSDGDKKGKGGSKGKNDEQSGDNPGFDDHTYWEYKQDGDGSGSESDDANSNSMENEMEQIWLQRMVEATEIATHIAARKGEKGCGKIPLLAERMLKELTEPKTDWRQVLQNFIQEEITDYSFNPPDRRMQDSAFILPDFNEKDENPRNIWFCIDTSGSVSDEEVTAAYSEICGAIEQFEGHLAGWLSLFDHEITEPESFENVDDVLAIKPVGGGGTSFEIIFEMLENIQNELEVACIVIITDGYAPFPKEEAALGIPVLWLINNDKVDPPWGKVARM